MQARSPVDHLTKQERHLVRARLEHPDATHLQLAKFAGLVGSMAVLKVTVSRAFRRPEVIVALAHPPPELDPRAKEEKVNFDDPVVAKQWLRKWYVTIVQDRTTPQSERIRALNAVAEMTPGAKVPVGLHHTGAWTLEKFVAAAGGAPSDHVSKTESDEMPN